ncbi:PncB Nicotinic acid phosphoribosyltransferase [uncultured Caudovirales phage]|uniref:Nicotinamide phosphoribosyltransferase n=1 Tax=uncultured Caudovirales phage TaxID=2100421 RepID=A0A6J5LHW0_9CAUD|nr:PncB Nicotinic acid phosphoribosyltransferase [uncultured Caudovirales phage]
MVDLVTSVVLSADSYKYSQFNQYPEGTEYVYSYISSRGGPWPETVVFGLQYALKKFLARPVTREEVETAALMMAAHGEPFNKEGWEHILMNHGGLLPVKIRAVPEGTRVPVGNVIMTITNTDPKCAWLVSFLETLLLRSVWYPTTVATNSYESKKIIKKYLEATGDPSLLGFKLHDFGFRGVSSLESGAIGGLAHLVNFMGTDTVGALVLGKQYYDADMAGFSIPAMEHSTVTSWGREGEEESFRNMLKQYGKPGAILACVSDSYNIYKACELWGTKLKDEVIASGATVVIRPDSGEPSEVVLKCIQILEKYFGSTTNSKGFKVLNNVRVIQGDGIDHSSIHSILAVLYFSGYSADNVAFGQGGALLQKVDRDTMKFAMKCSAIGVNVGGSIEWRDVFKDPVTDQGKRSLKGRVELFKDSEGKYYTDVIDYGSRSSELVTVFEDGKLFNTTTLDEVRARAAI